MSLLLGAKPGANVEQQSTEPADAVEHEANRKIFCMVIPPDQCGNHSPICIDLRHPAASI
jgi:hypothetical protein